ncbi:hypothetical protein, partial [Streptosporangium sp. NPDC048865]|uniref:hypothetical protein n=1 Tax=Streptosporangium sp. NPDC048865 TaxID=3155766 RepID=UPI0034437D83
AEQHRDLRRSRLDLFRRRDRPALHGDRDRPRSGRGGGTSRRRGASGDRRAARDLGAVLDRGVVVVGFMVTPIPSTWPNTCRRKIGESNTMSIELPYDVVHHGVADFEDIRTIV